MKLVASMIVKNELARYLPECIGHLRDFCDLIVVVNDGSSDRTGEWLDQNSTDGMMIVHHLDPEDGFFAGHEGRKRQKLLDLTLAEHPDWVLAIDADEFVSDGALVREFLDSPRQVGTLSMEEVWKAQKANLQIRMDGGWRPHQVPCLYRANLQGRRSHPMRIANKALACGREPEIVRRLYSRSKPTEASILHFGWANEYERRARYERYVTADGGRFHRDAHLQSIMWPDMDVTLEKRPWPKSLLRHRDVILETVWPDEHKAQREMIDVTISTRIDLLWGELTDQDKIGFAKMVRDVAAENRARAHDSS